MRPNSFLLTLLAIVILLLSGCNVQSLYPFASEKMHEIPESIIGQWSPIVLMGEDELPAYIHPWHFQTEKVITYDEKNISSQLIVNYFHINNQFYLQYLAGDAESFGPNFYWLTGVTPVFSLCKIILQEDQLTLLPASIEYLKKYKENHPKELPCIETENNLLFTTPTEEWISFITKHNHEEFFPTDSQFVFTRNSKLS